MMKQEKHTKQMIKQRKEFINERRKELENHQNIQNTWKTHHYNGDISIDL